jgi:hypothetical protein
MSKTRKIKEQLDVIEKRLANAEAYIAKNVNVEGASFLHFDDWKGKSGHPLWMKNFMIPSTKRGRARKEKAVERIRRENKSRRLKRRRRQSDCRRSAVC